MNPAGLEELEAARRLLAAGSTGKAVAAARAIVDKHPDLAPANELLAEALEASGDRVGAEATLRDTLVSHPNDTRAATRLARLITPRRGASEAASLLEKLANQPTADAALFTALGVALKTSGRKDEAVDAYRKAAKLDPTSASAQHNLAGALGDAHRFPESLAATETAFEMGLDAPETWLVRGRSLSGIGKLDEAESAFRRAIGLRPDYADALAELGQLIWMRTEDPSAATKPIDDALAFASDNPALCLAKAKLLECARGREAAYEALAKPLANRPGDLSLQIEAAMLILPVDAELGLAHAQRAFAMAPDYGPAASALCQAHLAMGRPDEAARLAEGLCRDWPLDQHPVTLAATAWRLMGDKRYGELFDYIRLVRRRTIATPPGWPTLEAYLADLAESLRRAQRVRGHPVGQSLRNGSQTPEILTRSEDPAIKAFFVAIDAPIREYIGMLSERDDLLGRRVTAGYRFSGAWSVILRPGGRHVDHIHPQGWISSAFHVELPSAIDEGRQGWLKFGEPGLATTPLLGPEHFEKPRAGDLVLFPSYMWHGTAPFGGDQPRLAIAFDVVPD